MKTATQTMKTATHQTAEDAYANQCILAMDTVEHISKEMSNLPAPSDMTHWGHVGDITEIRRMLNEVLSQMRGQ